MLGGGSVRRRRGQRTIAGRGEVERADWVDATTSERPALLGLDMMDDAPWRVERGTTSNGVEQAIACHQAGGMVQVQSYGNAPTGLIDEPGDEWYRGFSTEATTSDVAEAMADPDSEGYHLLVRDLDAIASQPPRRLGRRRPGALALAARGAGRLVVVGRRGTGTLQRLCAPTWDRLVNVHGPHDLIRVWTSRDSPEALGWCPGDDRVDRVGADIFPATGTYPTSLGVFGRLVDVTALDTPPAGRHPHRPARSGRRGAHPGRDAQRLSDSLAGPSSTCDGPRPWIRPEAMAHPLPHWCQSAITRDGRAIRARTPHMVDSFKDRLDSATDKGTGQAKEAFGDATDQADVKRDGQVYQVQGEAKDGIADLKDKGSDLLDKVKGK